MAEWGRSDGGGARREILAVLGALPLSADAAPTRDVGLSAPDIAERLGLHVTTVRFHLDQLLASGEVVPGRAVAVAGRRGRPARTYAAAVGPLQGARDDRAYRMLAELLTDLCGDRGDGGLVTPEQAGRRWAERHTRTTLPSRVPDHPRPSASASEWIGRVGQVVEFLTEWGYDLTVHIVGGGRAAEIELAHCPFAEMARTREEVVCGIHRGLVGGALEVLGEEGTRVGLDPFVTPHLCRVRLTSPALPTEETTR